jgi:hypothetical protein
VDGIRHRRLRFDSAFSFPERDARFRREQDRFKEPLSWMIRSDLKPAHPPDRAFGLCARHECCVYILFSRTRRAILGNAAPSRTYRSR